MKKIIGLNHIVIDGKIYLACKIVVDDKLYNFSGIDLQDMSVGTWQFGGEYVNFKFLNQN